MKILDFIDRAIEKFVQEKIKDNTFQDSTSYFRAREARWKDDRAAFIAENVTRVHSNTGSLLTHISAMIASLAIIMIVFEDSSLVKFMIFIEMIAYTFFAAICLYCLRYHRELYQEKDVNRDEYIELYYNLYLNRRFVYHFTSNGVFVVTVIFIMTLMGHATASAWDVAFADQCQQTSQTP